MEAERPRQKVTSDLLGPIDLNHYQSQGKAWILLFNDVFSSYSKMKLLFKISGEEIVSAFKEM